MFLEKQDLDLDLQVAGGRHKKVDDRFNQNMPTSEHLKPADYIVNIRDNQDSQSHSKKHGGNHRSTPDRQSVQDLVSRGCENGDDARLVQFLKQSGTADSSPVRAET